MMWHAPLRMEGSKAPLPTRRVSSQSGLPGEVTYVTLGLRQTEVLRTIKWGAWAAACRTVAHGLPDCAFELPNFLFL